MEGSVKASGVKVGMVGKGVGEGIAGKGVVVGNANVGRGKNTGVVAEGLAGCVSAKAVLTVDMAVSIISSGLCVAVDGPLLQDASITAVRNKRSNTVLPEMFMLPLPLMFIRKRPTGRANKAV
jgi:hypothetical protein